jgi:phage tail-like protein
VSPTDPYANFRFLVKWDDRTVAGVSKVSALQGPTEIIKHRGGGDRSSSRKIPGQTAYEPIMLERGVTHDAEFARWAHEVSSLEDGVSEVSLRDFRKDLRIEVRDEAGRLAAAYVIHDAWVSEFSGMPDLDANANAVAIESLKLENEGWERDASVAEPADPPIPDPG